MKGTISFYNADEQRGSIKGDDGNIYDFTLDNVNADNFEIEPLREVITSLPKSATYKDCLVSDLRVGFEVLEDDSLKDIYALKEQNLILDKVHYMVPKEVGIALDIPKPYQVIDKAEFLIHRTARNPRSLMLGLISDCKALGGNVLIDFEKKQIVKNSIGFSYYLYEGQGIVAVMAYPDEKGTSRMSLLKSSINHKRIAKIHKEDLNNKLGIKLLKILGAFLLVMFTIGFILAK